MSCCLVLDWFGHYGRETALYITICPVRCLRRCTSSDNEETYSGAINGGGILHHAAASYGSPPIIDREDKAVRAVMLHLKKVDTSHVVVGIQMENEISVFGGSARDPNFLRDHSPASNEKFTANHFNDDLRYSAWDLSESWMRPLTDAAANAYPIPIFSELCQRPNHFPGEICMNSHTAAVLFDTLMSAGIGLNIRCGLETRQIICVHLLFVQCG